MINPGKISKQITRPADSYLKFVQQSFNVDSSDDFKDILKALDAFANSPSEVARRDKKEKDRKEYAKRLHDEATKITILYEPDKYTKFNKLGDLSLSSYGLRQAYGASDEIIKDINVARDWIDDYRKFRNKHLGASDPESIHNELLILGKSILGRAIELCPMKSGYLRSTGILYDFGTHIWIAFTAPYATYVHENLEIKHPLHGGRNCGGRAKFLEIALQEFFPDKTVWTEHTGKGVVLVAIGLNPLWIEYEHYGG